MASQTFEIHTVAGLRFYDGEGGFASHVAVNSPYHVAFHPVTEDVFIADTNNHVIRKIDQVSGRITTVAGIPYQGGYSGDGGLATQATLLRPESIAFSPDGKLMYIADVFNSRVRMVKDGIITTVAGNGTEGFDSDDVQATSASLKSPISVTVVPTTGELVIADKDDHRIRKVDNGIITTIAGTGVKTDNLQSNLGDNGPAANATLSSPQCVIAILLADTRNCRIRKIDTSGVITTIAGTGECGLPNNDVQATQSRIGTVSGLAINSAGDLFLADRDNSCITKVINSTQTITTVAGICRALSSRSLSMLGENGSATTSYLSSPSGVAVNSRGEMVISDISDHTIRKIDTNGIMNTIAGNGFEGFSGQSGIAMDAMLNYPTSVAVTNDGEIFIGDSDNFKIRKIDMNGIITATVGNGRWGYGGDGGSALNAMLRYPEKLLSQITEMSYLLTLTMIASERCFVMEQL